MVEFASEFPYQHELASSNANTLEPLCNPRQESVTPSIDTCDPGSESESRGTSYPSAGGSWSRSQEEEDVPAVGSAALRGKIASFDPFRLYVTERVLKKNGTALKIGSRALDILIMLLEHAPEVVSKRDLIGRVWGRLVVDEVSLRFHVAALRKQLADGDPTGHYVKNIPGRGYCFAAAVRWTEAEPRPKKVRAGPSQLPREPLLMVGRDHAGRELTTLLKQQRFVSIVGAGGIGKTTMALALAHRMLAEFDGAVHFLDLGAVEDSRLPASLLASHLGLVAVSDQPLPVILSFLRERRVLLVFDSCEHLIEACATLTENIFRDAPEVHILVTSREALRAEGEKVHHLPPLECPPADTGALTAAEALNFPAVQLFVKHVANSGHAFELTDADAPIVAEICRRLDGIALALELAASRVGVHGVRGTASLLDKQFRLLWRGRRTALPRHQTLSATLDWSYNLLSEAEQLVLRRLAVFVGGLSLDAALDVAAESLDPAELTETLATLADKSLVMSDRSAAMRYRLLDTTRAYAWQKLTESGEDLMIVRRHCEYMIHALERFDATIWALPSPESMDFFVSNLSNLRAALEWSFSDQGDSGLGARLTGASACLFSHASLLPECVAWTERAIRALDARAKGTPLELEVLACFAASFMTARGNDPTTHSTLVHALGIAERLKAAPMQLYLLQALYKWQIRSGDFRGFRELTERVVTVAKKIADPLGDAIAHGYFAITCFFTCDNDEVGRHAHIALRAPFHLSKLNEASVGPLRGVKSILARNLWVSGYPEQAMSIAEEVIQETEALNDPNTLCHILMSGLIVPLETGDWNRAQELVNRLSSISTELHLFTYARASIGWQGCLAVSRGDLARGIALLQTALAALHEDGYELYRPQLSVTLAEALAKFGQRELAYSTICESVIWAETRGRVLNLIDLLRVKGEILMSMSAQDAGEGEACLLHSLQFAQERGLLSLELRTGISLTRVWAQRGQRDMALGLLDPLFNRFSEGFQTRDLLEAANLLQQLRSRN
jgi:predicted ATPase/DNA-binding winged helix-turn-helix (wHTH) protein